MLVDMVDFPNPPATLQMTDLNLRYGECRVNPDF